MARPAVLFDLDGTLLDTAYLHTYAWWRALDEAGELRPMSAVHPLIGMGSRELLCALLGRHDQGISDAHGRYFSELHPQVRVLPGAATLLRAVAAAGGQVAVVTSAKPRDLPALLGPLGCDDVIDELVHGEEADQAKPAPDLLELALARAGVDPGRTVSVGDAVWDVQAARRVGVRCVAVATGGVAPAVLREAGAAAVYDSCADLLGRWDDSPLSELLGARPPGGGAEGG